ncbi:OmpA family protein [Tenacibaculum finnmarkense]|uniref:OmpA family protein n=1 Tax=Tenacibaculum finnmarkense TaxID=2781243 RepID=UPI00187B8492|nr:OmpA family protein [Tenacibaculum finnmarkense]MBE7693389.1 OmpA family protein [Tenacibaculum finnmarkense genomovar finnmarkense]MCD8447771.1 OmpA family protein [Tenacibaculum finnmarkense genomovar finnmarkense]
MKTKITFLLLFFLVISSFSQKKIADKFFENYAYIKAAEFYEKTVKKGDSSTYILTRLGDCYYNNSNSEKATKWYNLAAKTDKGLSNETIYKYAQSLRSAGSYKKADQWLKKLPNNKQGATKITYENLKTLNKDSVKVINLAINTRNSDFGAYVHNNKFIFASTKNKKGRVYKWNNEPYLDLYEATIDSTSKEYKKIKNVIPIKSSEVNTSFHESNIAITNDGKTMYFTRNNLTRRDKLDYDKKGTSHLKIFKATLINGSWSNIKELSINDDVYSSGHPALSPDDKTLYFTSDRPGGYGLTDIYKTAILDNGSYGAPVNMGENINTSGREMFPFVSKQYVFYFSSDGYQNLGFLDIFKSNLLKNNSSEVTNMGAPFNSRYDDFCFFINKDNKTGYFSSNRPKGKGHDDIYSFESYKCKQLIKGKTFNVKTDSILTNTLVELINNKGKVIKKSITGLDGAYSFEVDCNKKYALRGSKKDYKADFKKTTTTNTRNKEIVANLYLTPLIIDKEIVISPIFFDFDKSTIRPDAAFELEYVVKVLKNHPKMIIKIEAHTDSRGDDDYNETLSDKRAKSTRDYILSRDIDPSRIESAIGFGEKKLVNKCINNAICTEEEHQENRRSKFIIINNYK